MGISFARLTTAIGSTIAMAMLPAFGQEAYPVAGKSITVLVPFAAGGPSDVGARTVAPFLEKELGQGTTIQIVNKPGAATQVANTELARAKPDGYTIAIIPPASISATYLDPARQAPYTRKDFTAIAHFTSDANMLIVPGNSPYKTLDEFVAAARAKPKSIRVGDVGLMGNTHLAGIALEEAAKVRFAFVHFSAGAAPLATALLGGNLDAAVNGTLSTLPHERAGTMRILGVMNPKRTPFFPNAKTMVEQGYDVLSPTSFGFFGPANLPKDIVKKLSDAIKKAASQDEVKKKLEEVTLTVDYMDTEEFEKYWTDAENRIGALLKMAKERGE